MDAIVWIVGVVVVIALIAAFVVWIVKRSNAKYAQLWPALASMVDGTFKSSKMTGTYNGMPVQARINAVSNDNSTEYFYELTLTPGAQGKDWALSYTGDKLLGLGEKHWHIKTKDHALEQRLSALGVIDLIEDWRGHPNVTYKSKHGILKYETRVHNAFELPAPDQFKAQLDLLARLAQINAQANVAA